MPLQPKVFDTLLVLVENAGRLVDKETLIRRLWPDTAVEDGTLARNISDLRKALGQTADQIYIETVPKVGYRFVADVAAPATEAPLASAAAPPPPSSLRWVGIAAGLLILAAMAATLLWRTRTPGISNLRSVAVLPFQVLDRGHDSGYLGLGMADILITRLSGRGNLTVRPTSAIQKYVGPVDVLAAGKEQQVDGVLEGTIHRQGDRARVTLRLIRVKDGSTVWTASLDEPGSDAFRLEDAAANRVMAAFGAPESAPTVRHATENPKAYMAYVKGRYFWNRRSSEALRKALDQFHEALAADPNYARAYAGLADTYMLLGGYGIVSPAEAFPKARVAARKALELDDKLAEAHHSQATIYWNADWNWPAAEREFRRTIELDPNYAPARHYFGEFLTLMGRFEEGRAQYDKALRLDPASLIIQNDAAAALFLAGKHDEALQGLRQVLEMDPRFTRAHFYLTHTYLAAGRKQDAIQAARRLVEIDDNAVNRALLGSMYAAAGNREEALRVLRWLQERGKTENLDPQVFASIFVNLDDRDQAFFWMEKAFAAHSNGLTGMKVWPMKPDLRSDPRHVSLMERMRLN